MRGAERMGGKGRWNVEEMIRHSNTPASRQYKTYCQSMKALFDFIFFTRNRNVKPILVYSLYHVRPFVCRRHFAESVEV